MQTIQNKDQTSLFPHLVEKRRLSSGEDVFSLGQREIMTLWSAVDDYRHGKLILPPHQRDISWSDQQQAEYVQTICSDSTPPGCFEIYQLRTEGGRLSANYLNDGSQRLRTAKDFLDNPDKYGVTKEDAEYILRNTSYPYTKKIHASHQEALLRFQIVNNNLPLTPYQMSIGEIAYCQGNDRYEDWLKLVRDLHAEVLLQAQRIAIKSMPNRKSKTYLKDLHRWQRHDLSLFLRHLMNERAMVDYRPGDKGDLGRLRGNYPEKQLAVEFQKVGLVGAREELEKMSRILKDETALIENAWNEVRGSPGRGIDIVVVRWLYDVAIWRRNNKISAIHWNDFLKNFLKVSQGGASIVVRDASQSSPKRLSITISRVATIQEVCSKLKLDFLDKAFQKRQPQNVRLKEGWHHSHVQPFSSHGEGDIFDEPASLNLARGAQPVNEGQNQVRGE
jgi:hypothetical protein